jgi:hypothetical protein
MDETDSVQHIHPLYALGLCDAQGRNIFNGRKGKND